MTITSSCIAVIGSGIAGIACAKTLTAAGRDVVVFDKGRRPGGRLASRRITLPDGTETRIDHGAQFATARDSGFADFALAAGVQRWSGERVVGAPTMRRLVEAHLHGLEIKQSVQITEVTRADAGWTLTDSEDGKHGPFAALVSTVPAPQAAVLFPETAEALGAVEYAPCWATLLVFGGTLHEKPDEIVDDSPDALISWAAREGAKPGRESKPERWILHAGAQWSRDHLEDSAEDVLDQMIASFAPGQAAVYAKAHRWRYAKVTAPLGEPCHAIADGSIILAGDWCLSGRVESAYLSGKAAAQKLLRAGE